MGKPNVNINVGGATNGTQTYKTVVLKPNIPFAQQLGNEDTIYVIKWDYDLDGEEVSVPANCVLKFEGGSLSNGVFTGDVEIINMPDDIFTKNNCYSLNIKSFKHLSWADVNEVFDNYREDGVINNRHEQNIVGSSYFYDISYNDKIYFMAVGDGIPSVRLLFYDDNFIYVSSTTWSRNYEHQVPEDAKYVSFSLSYSPLNINEIVSLLHNVTFSFINNEKVYISSDFKKLDNIIPQEKYQVSVADASRVWISVDGQYSQHTTVRYSSICIPYKVFKGYDYIRIQANDDHPCRVHILKKEPRIDNEYVQYSDYYTGSFLVEKKQTRDVKLPADARYIFISNESGGTDNTPFSIWLLSLSSIVENHVPTPIEESRRELNVYSQKFMHWNLGHFSNGTSHSTTINEDNYDVKRNGFNDFVNTYCPDCHYLFNEYSSIFAVVNGVDIPTSTNMFTSRKTLIDYPIINWNHNAGYIKDGLRSYIFGTFSSLKGVKNSSGTMIYGDGYCLYSFYIGKSVVYIMHVHLPHSLTQEQFDKLDDQVLNILSSYPNVVIVGDLNRSSRDAFYKYTDAGYTIANTQIEGQDIPTFPSRGTTLDWVMYKLRSNIVLSDFRVYPEAVDANEDLLSDHLPISFTVTETNNTVIAKNIGTYRFNRETLSPEWYNGNNWFVPTKMYMPINANTDLDNLTDEGSYICVNATIAATLSHLPEDDNITSAGFILEVERINSINNTGVITQKILTIRKSSPIYIRTSNQSKTFTDDRWWRQYNGIICSKKSGSTSNRPSNSNEARIGQLYLDTDINKPIWVTNMDGVSTTWIEYDGCPAGVSRSGATGNRPASTDIYRGFQYFDTTLGKPIWYNGTAWVDATGTEV